jgi:D-alanyl-D-alanine dipeptidase
LIEQRVGLYGLVACEIGGARPAPHRYDRCVIPYTDPAALVDDPRVLRVAIADNGEPLIDVRLITALAADQSRADIQQLSDNPFHVRASVAEKLTRAQAALPDGYQLQVKEGWRPIWVQQRLWNLHLDQLQASRPDLTPEQARRENARFVAPPGIAPPHSTGGAVDVALVHDGRTADMGWGFNQPGDGSRTAAPVAKAARRHRDILASAMDGSGFINYPAEWWHWSYGDRYWAFQTGHGTTLYGPRLHAARQEPTPRCEVRFYAR